MRPMKAADVMTDAVITLAPQMTLQEAWEILFENRISGAPVVDQDGMVLGVLSVTDLIREAGAEGFSDSPKNSFYFDVPLSVRAKDGGQRQDFNEKLDEILVSEAMTKDPICVKVDDSISYLARTMRANHVHRLIVTNGQKLQGIISSLDLLKVMEMQ